METFTAVLMLLPAAAYMVWFIGMSRRLRGPRVWPLLGSLPGLVENYHRLHDWITENLRASGGTYQTCVCAVPGMARRQGLVTVTCDPRNLEHILKLRFDNYPKGPSWHAAFHDLLGDGIFNSDGETWRFQRKTAALEFTTRTLRQAMARWVSRAIELRLCPILDSARAAGSAVDLQDLLLRLTFDNICGLTFGRDRRLSPRSPREPIRRRLRPGHGASLHRFILPEFLWKLRRRLRLGMEARLTDSLGLIHEYLSEVVAARKLELARHGDDNLLSRFIKKSDYSDDFLRQVALNFILAGRDTSSAALCWFFWLVIRHPAVEEKIVAEMCSVLRETRGGDVARWFDAPLEYEEADQLVYLKAALTETLRLYPSVPEDSKQAAEDDVLPDGTFVPGGSSVTYSIYAAGRMKSVWGTFEATESFKFVAFNGGPRVCLGKDLAYLQMKSIAAAVLLRHRLVLVPGHHRRCRSSCS
ncbi:unnamed protein product [Spirodela intermedia]|uniref:Uncharacterized protein n=1 Tax=Spirodela intermedia TaxID=51605 RepID=A0A7I8IFC5_SPIIN|nr:unnamed protein product [Spirodela intermedia]CAA6655572.1 unnamed protein product [Spirodela intermedia]